METILRHFDQPDEEREFEKGRFQLIEVGGVTVGKATYQPGWKWSVHVGPASATDLCEVEHVGLVLAGHAVAAFADGTIVDLTAGTMFYVSATPHDSWVVGDEEYVSLHFLGAEAPFPTKIAPASLNVSTYIALYNYGYRNVYELGPLLNVSSTIIPFEGTMREGFLGPITDAGKEGAC